MHEAVGNQKFVEDSILQIKEKLDQPNQELSDAVSHGIGSSGLTEIETARIGLQSRIEEMHRTIQEENDHGDKHYVSRFNPVGIFQSALAKLFVIFPDLQGYGDRNPLWIITVAEEIIYKAEIFLNHVQTDRNQKQQSLWAALVGELVKLKSLDVRAPYPTGAPNSAVLPDKCEMTLLADWGGDNDAAHKIAAIVRRQKPDVCIHLGDIYYGGTQYECELFLDMWPMRTNMSDPNSPLLAKGSYALNGNHEMYSGGKYYFDTVLPALNQSHPFFCLENDHWRVIGLDTAYLGGRLKPQSAEDDDMNAQWNWLIQILKRSKKPTIFLTHHQPVSAHRQEYSDSQQLRQDIDELLRMDGIGEDAIFGWFFGHEHRCALYKDTALSYNARLIGNGCIPHQVQREKASDFGCTGVDYFNKKETGPGTETAVSMFVNLSFDGPELLIEYIDEDYVVWGDELWIASRARLDRDPQNIFREQDGLEGLSVAASFEPGPSNK